MKCQIKSADLLPLSSCPCLKKSIHLKLAFNVFIVAFLWQIRSNDLLLLENTMFVVCGSRMRSLFCDSLEADFSLFLCLATCLSCFSSSGVTANSWWTARCHADGLLITHICIFVLGRLSAAPFLWLLPWRNETCLLAGAGYAAAKAEECVLQWVLTFTFAACPNW